MRQNQSKYAIYTGSFNPRICKRCDTFMLFGFVSFLSFNPRICKRCDGLVRACFLFPARFNPRICKRCDSLFYYFHKVLLALVSIHASVKDATSFAVLILYKSHSFNPRICKRCDQCIHPFQQVLFCFNPRICKRCDSNPTVLSLSCFVSIHASVKDATPITYRSDWQ